MTTSNAKQPLSSHSLCQTSCHIFEEAGIGLTSMTSGQGETGSCLWAILMHQTPSIHTLGQDILIVAHLKLDLYQ